jgi:hypothetical protein
LLPLPHARRLRALVRDPAFDAFLQQVERHGAVIQHLVVEGFDVELRAEQRVCLNCSKLEVVVLLVSADPDPVIFAVALSGDGTITPADLRGVDATFLLEA